MACRGRKPSRHRNECNSCVGVFFRAQPNWSRRLPRPLTIPTVMELTTLADVRDLVEKHLPAPYRQCSTQLAEAAQSEKDLLEICVSLRLVLALEGVECLMK